jgi:uncharacterized SAM-binding protein YcdF (DUF218 family)
MQRGLQLIIVILLLTLSLFVILALSRSLLIIDRPSVSDVIIVPSGDFGIRSVRALQLTEQGYGKQLLIDEGSEVLTFGRTLADRRLDQTSEWRVSASVCPVKGESTYEESRECGKYLQELGARRVLIVTSDFHTRRALATFRKLMPSISFSVASAPTEFSSEHWWSPSSAATTCEEWGALLWLETVQR